MNYCCKGMEWADERRVIDYCPGSMSTLDSHQECYPINYCPFCGSILKGTMIAVKRINDAMAEYSKADEEAGR